MEHGHAVLAYNCPQGCDDVVGQLTAIRDAQRSQGNTRIMVVPDTQLPARVAALVWGWGWTGDTVDDTAIDAVLALQDSEAPEPHISCPQ